ncbi:hypothetical protein O181_077351 [Austropuccinia psidii MF-1]|uniref:Uncharacterized protein n=1 Tax=Austropuccinia psidii MF-1 TaxID=1389203 RepID=A0A9Q3FHX0_9BASI|nr:hypothetical protein [Austropuccinia psidii MF-1]
MAQKGHLGLSPPNERGGPEPRMMARGPGDPWKTKEPPGPKSRVKAWGLVRWKLAKKANDGRIWPEGINGHWNGLWRKSHRKAKGANLPQLGSRLDCRNHQGGGSNSWL